MNKIYILVKHQEHIFNPGSHMDSYKIVSIHSDKAEADSLANADAAGHKLAVVESDFPIPSVVNQQLTTEKKVPAKQVPAKKTVAKKVTAKVTK